MHGTPTLGPKKYFMEFINDCIRYYYVYLLHSKDEIMHKLKTYKSEVELHCETFIKCLRFDRGGEYYHVNYFESIGMKHELTVPYRP